MFRVNNKDKWRRFGVFIVNFEHISHLCSGVSVVNFEHVTAGWFVWKRLLFGKKTFLSRI